MFCKLPGFLTPPPPQKNDNLVYGKKFPKKFVFTGEKFDCNWSKKISNQKIEFFKFAFSPYFCMIM